MNAIQNETRLLTAKEKRERATRWSERLLTALDALATAALWGVFASTFVRCALVPSERGAASTFVFLTFATIGVYVLRETVWVWRESPCRLPKSEFRARVRSFSLPIWGTAAVVAATLGANRGGSAWASVGAIAVYVLAVDLGAARFARRWGATVARDWRLAFDVDSLSPKDGKNAASCDATQLAAVCCAVEEKGVDLARADDFDEENAEGEDGADGETIAMQRRVRAQGGGTQIFGSIAVEFESETEVAPVFIAFCPPFEGIPSFDFEQVAGPEIAVQATSVQPFGVRLEAKRRLAQNAESQDVANGEKIQIEYFASFPPFDESDEAAL
ncbi:MAG: hypothetical protein IKW13_06940 [Thermoguttaceae bacterium]|nr:hypothetical protein [Thermoguttaceae bacterium]